MSDTSSAIHLTEEPVRIIVSAETISRVQITDLSHSGQVIPSDSSSQVTTNENTVSIENEESGRSDVVFISEPHLTLETSDPGVVGIITAGFSGPPGPRGPIGEDGPPGPRGEPGTPSAIRMTSPGNFSGHRVISSYQEIIQYADCRDESSFSVIGVTNSSATIGEELVLSLNGVIDYPGELLVDQPVFLGEFGMLTQVVPTHKYMRKMGVAISQNQILLNIGETYTLG